MKKFLSTASVAVFLFCFTAGQSFAATTSDTKADVTITAGDRDITIDSDQSFDPVQLNGQSQNTEATPGSLKVVDATGSGSGWHVMVSADQMHSDTHKIPAGSLTLFSPSAVTAEGTTSAKPIATSGKWFIDSGSAVNVLSADNGTGMGTFETTFDKLALTVPADTFAGDYQTTLNWEIVTGP